MAVPSPQHERRCRREPEHPRGGGEKPRGSQCPKGATLLDLRDLEVGIPVLAKREPQSDEREENTAEDPDGREDAVVDPVQPRDGEALVDQIGS